MRIAVGIIGLMVGLLCVLQSCTVAVGSHLVADQSGFGDGAAGMMVGALSFIGGAFAFGLPGTASVIFVLAGLVGVLIGSQGSFSDLSLWGGACLILAVMAFFGRRRKRRAGAAGERIEP